MTSFERYGGVPSNIIVNGNTEIIHTIESVRRLSGCQPSELYITTVTLIGCGSSMEYEILGGGNPKNRPNIVRITHL